jgi:hypothetical protein
MALESRQILIDDLKRYSDALVLTLKKENFLEAREYVSNVRTVTESISDYVESNISLLATSYDGYKNPTEIAHNEAERAVLSSKRAQEKVERLERAARDSANDAKRFNKAANEARKEAGRARKAAEKAEKDELKAQHEAKKAAEQANKANQAARRS